MSLRLAFINEKGGTAKTTLAVHAAAYLALSGKKTALLDMDPQGHVGKCLEAETSEREPSLFEALATQSMSLSQALKPTRIENLWAASSDKRMANLTLNIASDPERHIRLARAIDSIEGFDAILIDSPPSLGLPTVNILMAAREVVIPVPVNFLGLDGCTQVLRTIIRLRKVFAREDLKVRAFVPVMFHETERQKRLLKEMRRHFGSRVTRAVIPYDEAVDLAQARGRTVFEISPQGPSSLSMQAVFAEIFSAPDADPPPQKPASWRGD